MKSEIMLKLAETIYSFMTYPTLEDFECVAKALVEKHPCLTEPGSTCGWYGWKHSIKVKMGSYRQKSKALGFGKRNKVKKLPQGRDSRSLEEDREKMVQDMRKTTQTWPTSMMQ